MHQLYGGHVQPYAAEQCEVGERRANNPLHESDDSATVEVETSAWKVGDVVDVDTDDGWELGAQIIGPAESGEEATFRIRFADGVTDEWSAEDFRLHARDSR